MTVRKTGLLRWIINDPCAGDDFAFVAKAAVAKWGGDYFRADICCRILSFVYTPSRTFSARGLPISLALCLGAILGVCMPTIGI